MSQNLVSNLTSRIEQEKQMMQMHQENIEQFQEDTAHLLNSAKQSLQHFQADAQHTTENATNLLVQAQKNLVLFQLESKNLVQVLQQQTKETATLLNEQAEQLNHLKTQSAQLNNMSQEIAETSRLRKNLFTSNIILISVALIFTILSISLIYISKSKYNDIKEMQNKVNYLKSQGGSMITTKCDGKLCVQVDPEYMNIRYETTDTKQPLVIVKEVN